MKHIKTYRLFESQGLTQEQERFLNSCVDRFSTWTFNQKTGLVDIEGSFHCGHYANSLTDFLGIRFGHVTGNFIVSSNQLTKGQLLESKKLTSLGGAPQRVDGNFNCGHNALTDLEGAPQIVGGDFFCHGNKLTTLEGGPREVGGRYLCQNNLLVNLKGAPLKPKCLHATINPLESLEGIPNNIPVITEIITPAFMCDAFLVREWNTKIMLQILSGHLDGEDDIFYTIGGIQVIKDRKKAKDLILSLITPKVIDDYLARNPLDIDLLDGVPDIKAGVLQRTGIKDMSTLARSMRKGMV